MDGILYTLMHWTYNLDNISILKLVLSCFVCLCVGTLYLEYKIRRYGKENLTDWDCTKGYYYSFLYSFLGSISLCGVFLFSAVIFMAILMQKSTRIFWIHLVPMVSFFCMFYIDPIEKDMRTLWEADLKFLQTITQIVLDSLF